MKRNHDMCKYITNKNHFYFIIIIILLIFITDNEPLIDPNNNRTEQSSSSSKCILYIYFPNYFIQQDTIRLNGKIMRKCSRSASQCDTTQINSIIDHEPNSLTNNISHTDLNLLPNSILSNLNDTSNIE